MSNTTYFLDYTQPNSAPRMEMLITIDYLLNKAYDKEHAAKQTDIVKYANEEYGMSIRRDRIAQILTHLEEIYQHSPNLLPFELGVVNLRKTKKYYIVKRLFKDSDIVKIVSAIKSDSKLSDEETNRLCSHFLDVSVNKEKRDEIDRKVAKRGQRVNKIQAKEYKTQEAFLNAIENKAVLVFKLKTFDESVGISRTGFRFKRMVANYVNEETYSYAYQTYTINKTLYLVLYIPNERMAILTKYNNVEFIRVNESWNTDIDFEIDNYDSIDDWVEKHFLGKDGILTTFKLKTTIGAKGKKVNSGFNSFVKSFESYWNKQFEYEVVEREVPLERIDENGERQSDSIIALDAVFTIEANYASFKNWYDSGIFDKAVILEPRRLNDRFLREKIKRYAKRLTKYGEKFNYEIIETLKPEYEEAMKKRIERTKKQKGD